MSDDKFINKIKGYIYSFDYRFLIFLLISMVLWLSLQFSKTNIQTYNLALNYIVPDTKLIAIEPDQKIVVKLKSKTWNLLSTNKFTEAIDIRLQDRYEQIVPEAELFNIVNAYIDDKYEIVSIIPSSIKIDLVDPIKKKVPVILKGVVNPKLGYGILNDVRLLPDSVIVLGSEKDLEGIDKWFTESTLGNDLVSDIDELVDLEINKTTNSISISPRQVRVQVEIDQFAEKLYKRQIVSTETDDLSTIPTYALVKLSVPLRSLDKIYDKDIEIGLYDFDYNDTTSQYKITLKSLPKYCKLLKITPDSTTVFRNKTNSE